jgi:ankyrin repeat and BTB/POZ domain-containing protein 2
MYCTQDCTCSLCRELRGFKPNKPNNSNHKNNKNQLTKPYNNYSAAVASVTNNNNNNIMNGSEKKSKNPFKLKRDKDTKKANKIPANNDNFILCPRFLSDSSSNMGIVVNSKPEIIHAFGNNNSGGGGVNHQQQQQQRNMKKSLSYNELNQNSDSLSFPNFKYHLNRRDGKFNHQSALNLAHVKDGQDEKSPPSSKAESDPPGKHKVIIYFGDSIPNKVNKPSPTKINDGVKYEDSGGDDQPKEQLDFYHAQRLFEEMRLQRKNSMLQKERQLLNLSNEKYVKNFTDEINDKATIEEGNSENFMLQLKSVLEQKQRVVKENNADDDPIEEKLITKSPKLRKPPPVPQPATVTNVKVYDDTATTYDGNGDQELPPYIESIINGVINIKIEDNYQAATKLVEQLFDNSQATTATVASSTDTSNSNKSCNNNNFYYNSDDDDEDNFDWSFVQDWRTRYCIINRFFVFFFRNNILYIIFMLNFFGFSNKLLRVVYSGIEVK